MKLTILEEATGLKSMVGLYWSEDLHTGDVRIKELSTDAISHLTASEKRNIIKEKEITPRYCVGDFFAHGLDLLSLKGGPKTVDGMECNFHENRLTNLEFCPERVKGEFIASSNKLETLEFFPKQIGAGIFLARNKLTEDCFKYLPKKINGDLFIAHNKIKTLKDIHKHVEEINGDIWVCGNPIESHVLGLLMIKGLKKIDMDDSDKNSQELTKALVLIRKYLAKPFTTQRVYDCQDEMIELGLEEYAQL